MKIIKRFLKGVWGKLFSKRVFPNTKQTVVNTALYRLNYKWIDSEYYYDGDDLGAVIHHDKTVFKTWAPFATAVYLNLYLDGTGDNRIESLPMEQLDKGVWYVELLRNCDGEFYTYTFEYNHKRLEETIDIYAKACGVNGDRGAVVDFSTTNPKGWDDTPSPECKNPCDAVIYECHVRDFSIDESSGVAYLYRGKFLGMCIGGTKCEGVSTCLEHLKELGITHVQLLPVEDYATVDEAHPEKEQYNWGYDPKNYNCLEGSYSTDPADPKCRIREFKQLVQTLHKNGIGVIMDVVYNHTYYTEESAFERSFPYYYHRVTENGKFTNGSGCGNETASDHLMMRKFIIDSLKFWVKEYHIDGFRFDLMALHDIETVNTIRAELDKINNRILMYGEGWTGGESPIHADKLAYKWNSYQFGKVGLFNDNIRDSVKGGTFNPYDKGFVSGNRNAVATLKRGIVGSVPHHELHDAKEACWAFEPTQAINYCEAHDNNTLWDKLCICAKNDSEQTRIRMDKLSAAIVLLSQGVPFLQLGQDFLRTKPRRLKEGEKPNDINVFEENSYNSPDFTNAVRWDRKAEYFEVFRYYKALIKLRKSSSLFRMSMKWEVEQKLSFWKKNDESFIIFSLFDDKESFVIAFNPYEDDRHFNLPDGEWYLCCDEDGGERDEPVSGTVCCPGIAAVVYKQKHS